MWPQPVAAVEVRPREPRNERDLRSDVVGPSCFTRAVIDESAPPAFDRNPHLSPLARDPSFPCPYAMCEGTGFVLDDESNVARPCRCRDQRIALARSRSLAHEIPKKFRHVGFDRAPVSDMDPMLVREVRGYCTRINEKIDSGRGIWFYGPRGTGKTTLAMLISQYALRAHRSVAIYTAPRLLAAIRNTYEDDSAQSYDQLMNRLRAVELLHVDDLAVARTNEWVLEQLYTVINDRYQDERAILFTADVASPEDLAEHVGARTYSRLIEMCGDPIPIFGEDRRLQKYGA
jgi:DNA replication protein DnaC